MYLLYVSACIDSLLSLSTTLGNSQVRFQFLDGLRVNSAGGEHQGQITSNSRLPLAKQWEAILQYLHGIQKICRIQDDYHGSRARIITYISSGFGPVYRMSLFHLAEELVCSIESVLSQGALRWRWRELYET